MVNKTSVIDAIKTAHNELEAVNFEVETLKVDDNGEINTEVLIKYIEDVKEAIDSIQDEFEEYDSEVDDIEDDLEGLVKRLSEVTK